MQETLQNALHHFTKLTGLSLDISQIDPNNCTALIQKIEKVSDAYREKFSPHHLLYQMLIGQIPNEQILEVAKTLHMKSTQSRALFLIQLRSQTDISTLKLLRNLFPHQKLIAMDESLIALICDVEENTDAEILDHQAHLIVDAINTEAMLAVNVAYSLTFDSLFLLSFIYQQCQMALCIRQIFYAENSIICSEKLGLGKLIYSLPPQLCEHFLTEQFLDDAKILDDADVQSMINTFFENNLNIAETARQLHMHRNTLIYRLEQIEKSCNLPIKDFRGAMNYQIALMIKNYLNYKEEENLYE